MSTQDWRHRAPKETGDGKPLLSVDLHAELPVDQQRQRRMTAWDREREDSKIIFHKTIDGRYRGDGKRIYSAVGVLLISWEEVITHRLCLLSSSDKTT